MRQAFISSCSDPFLLLLVHKLFRERWYEEVDSFLVNINNHCGVPQDVVSELLGRLAQDKKTEIIYHPQGIGNGAPITEMTLISKADTVMLMEDDGFCFTPGVIDQAFQQIESGFSDVVGSPRFSCGVEVGEAAKEKYNLDYSGYGDVGPNLWPNMMFIKRKDLLRTDLDFSSHTWQPGEYSKELDHTFKDINHGDTAVWMCVQLKELGLRFHNIAQYHADPYEIDNKTKKQMNWINGPPTHIHGGSLSAGWNGYLSGRIPEATDDSSIQEMETRVAFWTIASACTDGFEEFKKEYQRGIVQLTHDAKLDTRRIEKKMNIYRDLFRI